jgi:hypothetical protein
MTARADCCRTTGGCQTCRQHRQLTILPVRCAQIGGGEKGLPPASSGPKIKAALLPLDHPRPAKWNNCALLACRANSTAGGWKHPAASPLICPTQVRLLPARHCVRRVDPTGFPQRTPQESAPVLISLSVERSRCLRPRGWRLSRYHVSKKDNPAIVNRRVEG